MHHVAIFENQWASREPAFWILYLGHARKLNYLLSRCPADGSIDILDAETPSSSVRLAFRSKHTISAHMDNDGQLHIIEFSQLHHGERCWHTIDVGSGDILSIEDKLLFLQCRGKLEIIHHAASHALVMLDPNTISIIDAASTEEISHWSVTPKHADPSLGAPQLGSCRFSAHGDMLAVTMHLLPFEEDVSEDSEASFVSFNCPSPFSSEIHIYKCDSGDCMQSVWLGDLPARHYQLRRSYRLGLLAVFSRCRRDSEASEINLGLLQILNPAALETIVEGESTEWCSQNLWDCYWTPDGDLLVACARPNSYQLWLAHGHKPPQHGSLVHSW